MSGSRIDTTVSVSGVLTSLPPLPVVTMVFARQFACPQRISVSASRRPVAEANRNHGSAQIQMPQSTGIRGRRLDRPRKIAAHLGALLLGYYADTGELTYAGRVGTGMPDKVIADLRRRLDPLARASSPRSTPSPCIHRSFRSILFAP